MTLGNPVEDPHEFVRVGLGLRGSAIEELLYRLGLGLGDGELRLAEKLRRGEGAGARAEVSPKKFGEEEVVGISRRVLLTCAMMLQTKVPTTPTRRRLHTMYIAVYPLQ